MNPETISGLWFLLMGLIGLVPLYMRIQQGEAANEARRKLIKRLKDMEGM